MLYPFIYRTFFLLCIFSLSASEMAPEKALRGPSWLQGGVIYSIFLRNFSPTGDFPGATERLAQLKELGPTILWLLPIQPLGQLHKKGTWGSPYAIRDYDSIDLSYGTKEQFKEFVEKAHSLGMKVILDAVLNHTSWDSTLMQYPDYYLQDAEGRIQSPLPEWNDVAALDYSNPDLRAYMIESLSGWIREFDIDGYRCDAAARIPLDFWEQVRERLHEIKPDILLLDEAEVPEALVRAFDLDYAWQFGSAMDEVFENGAPATTTFRSLLQRERESNPQGALHMRFSDNHDTKRSITRFGEKGALAAAALVFTLDGVPLIYNGMEIGDPWETHDPGMFEKRAIFWEGAELRPKFFPFYQALIALRKEHPAFTTGDTLWLENSASSRIATYIRRAGDQNFLIAINCSNRPFEGSVFLDPPSSVEEWTPRFTPSFQGESSLPRLSLRPWEFRLFRLSTGGVTAHSTRGINTRKNCR